MLADNKIVSDRIGSDRSLKFEDRFSLTNTGIIDERSHRVVGGGGG
jgi:hypothetical protein